MSPPHGAEADGMVVAPDPDYEHMCPLARGAVALALVEHARGVHEEPRGSNRGLDVDRYLRGRRGDGVWLLDMHGSNKGAPWCARFCLWCVEGAAADLGTTPPTSGAGGLASALKWRTWAKDTGRWSQTPHPGHVGVLIGKSLAGHVTLVLRVEGDQVISVEGNSDHAVRVIRRPAAEYAGFADLG